MFKRLLATFSFFTRLPFWRLAELKKEDYQRVVPFWPLAGWITGGMMALTFWGASFVLPLPVAVVLAVVARLMVTGALHEDGFADFFDGFGGGRDRQAILRIMKDSHIGTYGVLALVAYFVLLVLTLISYFQIAEANLVAGCFTLPQTEPFAHLRMAVLFLAADPFAKWASSNIINVLPYARKEEEAKNKLVYDRMTLTERVIGALFGFLPLLLMNSWMIVIPMGVSAFVAMFVMFLCHKKINAYTGDCCGACFVMSELAFYVTALGVVYI